MNNNNKNEQIHKLEREIWLFEQWLNSIDGQDGDTQARIRHAYKECIASRKLELVKLQAVHHHDVDAYPRRVSG